MVLFITVTQKLLNHLPIWQFFYTLFFEILTMIVHALLTIICVDFGKFIAWLRSKTLQIIHFVMNAE